ncbi:MAG TPA: lipid-binding SYLF domain-containing protein [Alphaproteobacteria bacterium]|nr:lipid-binding SYLF domain-containing protein [Alphaproteobacteria bacterium]
MISIFRTLTMVSTLALAGCYGGNPLDTGTQAERAAALQAECRSALDELYAEAPQSRSIAANAEGILVFPNVVKAGLMIGGESGNGCLLQGGEIVGYYNKSGGSFGFQAGAQSRSEVIMFMSEAALDQLRSRAGLEFGADASAAVMDVGAGGTLDTTNIDSEILAFIFGEAGLMASASLEGSKVTELDWTT